MAQGSVSYLGVDPVTGRIVVYRDPGLSDPIGFYTGDSPSVYENYNKLKVGAPYGGSNTVGESPTSGTTPPHPDGGAPQIPSGPTFQSPTEPGLPGLPGYNGSDYGQYSGGGSGGSSGGHWWDSVGGSTLINAGVNLLGGYLDDRSSRRAEGRSRADVEKRIRQALAQLDPAAVSALAKQYLPEIMAVNSPLAQTAVHGLRERAGAAGLLDTPYALTAEAGLRGQLANASSTQAFEQAMNTSRERAGVLTGLPFPQVQSSNAFGNAIRDTKNQAFGAAGLGRSRPSTPYVFPSAQPSRSTGSYDGYGFPDASQPKGVPFRWF